MRESRGTGWGSPEAARERSWRRASPGVDESSFGGTGVIGGRGVKARSAGRSPGLAARLGARSSYSPYSWACSAWPPGRAVAALRPRHLHRARVSPLGPGRRPEPARRTRHHQPGLRRPVRQPASRHLQHPHQPQLRRPAGLTLCPTPEPRPNPALPVIDIEPVSRHRPSRTSCRRPAGTACAGIPFTPSAPAADGTVTLTPSAPLILGPSAVGGPAGRASSISPSTSSSAPSTASPGSSFVALHAAAPSPSPRLPLRPGAPSSPSPAAPSLIPPSPPPMSAPGATGRRPCRGHQPSDTATVTAVPSGRRRPAPSPSRSSRPGDRFPPARPPRSAPRAPSPLVPTTPAPSPAPPATATFTPVPPRARTTIFVAPYSGDTNYPRRPRLRRPRRAGHRRPRHIDVVKTATPPTTAEPAAPSPTTCWSSTPGPRPDHHLPERQRLRQHRPSRPPASNVTCASRHGAALAADPRSRHPSPQLPATSPGTPGRPSPTSCTIFGTDALGQTATDNETPPSARPCRRLAVNKTANPTTGHEPGGDFTYTVRVTNTSP